MPTSNRLLTHCLYSPLFFHSFSYLLSPLLPLSSPSSVLSLALLSPFVCTISVSWKGIQRTLLEVNQQAWKKRPTMAASHHHRGEGGWVNRGVMSACFAHHYPHSGRRSGLLLTWRQSARASAWIGCRLISRLFTNQSQGSWRLHMADK